MHIIWQIQALVRTLPLNAVLKIIYLKHKLQTSKHKLMQANSDQQLSAIFEIHNSNLTSSFTWQIPALVKVLPLNAIHKLIYLKHELPSTKHLVSMDAYTVLLLQPSLKHFRIYKIQILQRLVTSVFSKLIYFMQSLSC